MMVGGGGVIVTTAAAVTVEWVVMNLGRDGLAAPKTEGCGEAGSVETGDDR